MMMDGEGAFDQGYHRGGVPFRGLDASRQVGRNAKPYRPARVRGSHDGRGREHQAVNRVKASNEITAGGTVARREGAVKLAVQRIACHV